MPEFAIGCRRVGPAQPPLVIAEIGINHDGSFDKALAMIRQAAEAGCECVKFQSHVVDDEMVYNEIVPANARETIWDMMTRCAFSEAQEAALKREVEDRGMIYLCTPFSRAAVARLARLDVPAYKIGSGECNNLPLVEVIAAQRRPVILSTGMNDLATIGPAVEILRRAGVPFALLHCTSMYPTPYSKVRLGAINALAQAFPDAVVGLSDHSVGPYTCIGAVALGACILEKHFTGDKDWSGPDIPVSLDPAGLRALIDGTRAVHAARGGTKTILPEEEPVMAFGYASVVSLRPIRRGEVLSRENLWVKRPGTGEIRAARFESVLGRVARRDLPGNAQLSWSDLE